MHSIEEKRVYGDREGAIPVYVASAMGVVRVRVAGDTVGEFSLCERRSVRDIAATDDAVAIATDEDVRVLGLEDGADDGGSDAVADSEGDTFEETGFGPAVAVGYDGSDLLAGAPDGEIARRSALGTTDAPGAWETLESDAVETIRAIDGDLVGTDAGVYRVHGDGLDHAGLTDVRDVSAAGVPLAATADGLYKLGNGWMEALEGSFETVAADPHTAQGRLTRAHAVSGETICAYDADAETWLEYDRSSDPIVAVGYGQTVYAVTDGGEFRSATPDGGADAWRSRTLGIRDVTGLAVPHSHSAKPDR